MYKPNGEERMTKQEETKRKAELAERKGGQVRAQRNEEAFDSSFYVPLMQASAPRENLRAAVFENLR